MFKDKAIEIIEKFASTHCVGRLIPVMTVASQPSVLVFAAHPDDDVLGVGITIHRHVLQGNRVRVIFTSNGGGHHRSRRDLYRYAETRYKEACAALAQASISSQDVGCLGFPDGRLFRYMTHIANDVKELILRTKPACVFVHSIEGGHRDHDITGFVVQSVCKQIGYTAVYEWSEYNSLQTLGDDPVDFPPYSRETPFESTRLLFTREEKTLKQAMLMAHSSQVTPMGLMEYKGCSELVRKCNLENLSTKLRYFWGYSINLERLDSLVEDFELFLEHM